MTIRGLGAWVLGLWIGHSSLASADESKLYDHITLGVTREAQAAREICVATLSARSEGPSLDALYPEVNRSITAAIALIRKVKEVRLETQNYQTQALYANQKPTGWLVQQSLRVDSRDPEKLGHLLGELQKTLKLEGLGFELSPETRQATEDRLISEGLQAFQARAERITQALGRSRYRMVTLTVDSTPAYRGGRPLMKALASAEALSSPSLEPGEETLSVTVQGVIELQPN